MAVLQMKKKAVVDIDDLVVQYDKCRVEQKLLKTRMDDLAKQIKEYALINGAKDDKGSCYCENDKFVFGATATKKVKLDEEAMVELCKSKGLSECLKVTTTLDYDGVDKAIDSGSLTESEVEEHTTITTNYAVLVKEKEVIAEVQESKLAASNKPKRTLRGIKR